MTKRLTCIWIVLLMCFSTLTAQAELSIGSQGDDVKQLEMKLCNMGFMNEKPDDSFGPETEAALRFFQRYRNTEETGAADAETLNALDRLWNLAIGVETEVPQPTGREPTACCPAEEPGGQAAYCLRHSAVLPIEAALAAEDTPPRLQRLLAERGCTHWIGAIRLMYEQWEESLSWQKTDIAAEQSEQFHKAHVSLRQELTAQYGNAAPEAHLAEMEWLKEAAISLCAQLYGPESDDSTEAENEHWKHTWR